MSAYVWGEGGGGRGFHSLANGLIKGYFLTYITFKVMAFDDMEKLEY